MSNRQFLTNLLEKLKAPRDFTFLGYLVLVFVLANLGSYFTIYDVLKTNVPDSYRIAQSLATSFVAIAVVGCLDIALENGMPFRKTYTVWAGVATILAVIFLIGSFLLRTKGSLVFAVLGEIVAVLIWIIANAGNPKLQEFHEQMRPEKAGHGQTWG